MKSSTKKYKVIPKNSDIDVEMALIQTTYALDAAAVMAEDAGDVEGMLSVAAGWLKFASAIEFVPAPPEKVAGSEPKFMTGFQGKQLEEVTVEEDIND